MGVAVKRKALALMIALTVSGLVAALHVNVAIANPGPMTRIPPVVEVPGMQVAASVSHVNGELWAKVDTSCQMNTTYAFGESYETENWGMNTLINPSRFVTVEVIYDRLDAQYPVPSDSTNVSVKMDGANVDYNLTKRTYHLFDDDMPELHWYLSPVPRNFSIATHYEHPLSTTENTSYNLGKNAFIIPFGARYGLQEIVDYTVNEYPWFGHATTAQIKLQIDSAFTNISAYTIDPFGSLKPQNYTLTTENGTAKVELAVCREETMPYGLAIFFDDPLGASGSFPTLLVAAVSVTGVALAATGLLIYRTKRKQQPLTPHTC